MANFGEIRLSPHAHLLFHYQVDVGRIVLAFCCLRLALDLRSDLLRLALVLRSDLLGLALDLRSDL
jgi:hypothetical protein